jgi:hypothetical protein
VGHLASRAACATLVDCDTRPIFAPVMIFLRRMFAFGTMPSFAVAPFVDNHDVYVQKRM